MKKVKVALIGAGNIMTTRHIPALLSAKRHFEIVGVLDPSPEKAKALSSSLGLSSYGVIREGTVEDAPWFESAEAVIAATPPHTHASVTECCLKAGKHVLIEKPFVTDLHAGERLIQLAADRKLVLAVNQNFQFSRSFSALEQLIQKGRLGGVRSFYCIQFSNDTRRLPAWGDDLPLGLFYDESPHAFYLLRRFSGGDLTVQDVSVRQSRIKENTPQVLDINLDANGLPATVYSNFESPICEWYFIVFGEDRYAMVDLFRDILTVLPNDGQHLMKEVFTTSFLSTAQHWKGFIANGFRYVRRKLHYGMDVTHRNFHTAITSGDVSVLKNMSGRDGLAVNRTQMEVARMASRVAGEA